MNIWLILGILFIGCLIGLTVGALCNASGSEVEFARGKCEGYIKALNDLTHKFEENRYLPDEWIEMSRIYAIINDLVTWEVYVKGEDD